LDEIQEPLELAQQRYKAYYDCNHRDTDYQVGQWVWLGLLHHPVASLPAQGHGKLGPKFFGPFKIVDRVGDVAYRLQLLLGACLHDIFHVGLLKKYCGEEPPEPGALAPLRHGHVYGRTEVLVRWASQTVANATRVELTEFKQLYPSFKLTDELVVRGGGGGRCYVWHSMSPPSKEGKQQ
jgi:hypothetical protein